MRSDCMQLLNNKEFRLISFLTYLKLEKQIEIKKIMKLLHCSRSTILSDIDYFNNNWPDLISITITKEQEISFLETSTGNINAIVKHIVLNSFEIRFLLEVFLNPNQNIYAYAEKLYTSPATLYRVIKRLDNALRKSDISIKRHQKKYYLKSSSDINLYLFFYKGLHEIYSLNLPGFTTRDSQLLFDKNCSSNIEEERYFLFLMQELSIQRDYLEDTFNYSDFLIIYEQIPLKTNFLNALESLQVELSSHLTMPSGNNDQLYELVYFTMKRDILLGQFGTLFFNRYTLFVNAYKKQKPTLFPKISKAVESTIDVLDLESEGIFDYLFYLIVTTFPVIEKQLVMKTIFIYSDLGYHHAKFVRDYLDSFFNNRIDSIHLVDIDYFQNYSYSDNHLIISTIKIHESIPTLFISDIISEEQLYDIKKKFRSTYITDKDS